MTGSMKDLLGDHYAPPTYPEGPGFKTGGTSRDAAIAVSRGASQLRDEVFGELKRGSGTAEEIADRLGLKLSTVAPRLTELTKETPARAIKTSARRPSQNSRLSRAVYKAAEETR